MCVCTSLLHFPLLYRRPVQEWDQHTVHPPSFTELDPGQRLVRGQGGRGCPFMATLEVGCKPRR